MTRSPGETFSGPPATAFLSRSPGETEAVGERLGRTLAEDRDPAAATVLLLHGPLGAGKTCFVRGLARGLECTTTPKSPTFALHLTCPGRRTLHHLDLYRLEEGMLGEMGLEDLFSDPGVVAVEWGERLGRFRPAGAVDITFEIHEGDERRLILEGPEPLVRKFAADFGAAAPGAAVLPGPQAPGPAA